MKFKESVTHPGDILPCVHVDDLLRTGVRDDLMWLKIQSLNEYALETKLMGGDDVEKKAVGRTLEWRKDGLGVRPDRRHVRPECVHATESHSGKGRRLE